MIFVYKLFVKKTEYPFLTLERQSQLQQTTFINISSLFFRENKCNVCDTLICKLVYLFGKHGRYIGNINHLW